MPWVFTKGTPGLARVSPVRARMRFGAVCRCGGGVFSDVSGGCPDINLHLFIGHVAEISLALAAMGPEDPWLPSQSRQSQFGFLPEVLGNFEDTNLSSRFCR